MYQEKSPVNKFVSITSAVSLLLGLLFGIYLLFKDIFLAKDINPSEVQIDAVLLAAGLLGNVLGFVLEKMIKDFIEKHLGPEVQKQVDVQIERRYSSRKEEDNRGKTDEQQNLKELDTVIVPVENTVESIRNKGIYKCPFEYSFKKDLKFIAFYKSKTIIGYGEIISDYSKDENGEKLFKIRSFINLNIPHDRPGAFVQNKMYCNLNKLIKAKNTDDIRDKN